jgi:hypothetical protein
VPRHPILCTRSARPSRNPWALVARLVRLQRSPVPRGPHAWRRTLCEKRALAFVGGEVAVLTAARAADVAP